MACQYTDCFYSKAQMGQNATIPCPECNNKFYCSEFCRIKDW